MTKIETKFYNFCQNNSGGHFAVDENVAHNVWIEAASMREAIAKAEELGIYFNGCASGQDCNCCGDRWHEPWTDAGKTEEEMRADIQSNKDGKYDSWTDPEAYIHFYDGSKEAIASTHTDHILEKRRYKQAGVKNG